MQHLPAVCRMLHHPNLYTDTVLAPPRLNHNAYGVRARNENCSVLVLALYEEYTLLVKGIEKTQLYYDDFRIAFFKDESTREATVPRARQSRRHDPQGYPCVCKEHRVAKRSADSWLGTSADNRSDVEANQVHMMARELWYFSTAP